MRTPLTTFSTPFTASRSSRLAIVVFGWLLVGGIATCFGLIAAHGYGLYVVAFLVVIGGVVWAVPRPTMIAVVLLGVILIPTPAIAVEKIHSIPLATTLGVITLCGALFLLRDRRARGVHIPISGYSMASLLLFIIAGVAQLGFSHYADIKPLYQFFCFWLAGLILGSIIAADRRMLDQIGFLALPLAVLAIFEFAIHKPLIWGNVVDAHVFDSVVLDEGTLRASSTFGHPLVAGAVLIVMAFLVLNSPGRARTIVFPLIVAGAIATVSRSALVGLGVGLLFYVIGTRRHRSRAVALILITAAVGLVTIISIPALDAAFTSRVLGASSKTEGVRLNSLHTLESSFEQGEITLLVGRGLQGSKNYLAQTGGNLGFGVYDNQYVTSLYDSGGLVLLAALGLLIAGLIIARPGPRLMAPLAAAAATIFFFEGLYWPVMGLFFWLAVGLATAPRHTDSADIGLKDRPRPSRFTGETAQV